MADPPGNRRAKKLTFGSGGSSTREGPPSGSSAGAMGRGTGPSRALRAALYTLGGNLIEAVIPCLADHLHQRAAYASSMNGMLKSGIPGVKAALLKNVVSDDKLDVTALAGLYHPPLSRATDPNRFVPIDLALGWIEQALAALADYPRNGLASASGGSLTSEVVQADILGAQRALREFDRAMQLPRPLPAEVLHKLRSLADRFVVAADLLRASDELGQPSAGSAGGPGRGAPAGAAPGRDLPIRWPVPIAEAAAVIGIRSDYLLAQLRRVGYPVGGSARRHVADLDHIILCRPGNDRKLKAWANREYPPAD